MIQKAKWLLISRDFALHLTNSIVPSQAIGLAIPLQTYAIIIFIHSNADLSQIYFLPFETSTLYNFIYLML